MIAEPSKGVSGQQVMERALREGRVLIKEDRDFGLLVMRARGEVIWGFKRQKICSNSGKRAYHCLSRGS
jgi:hypothetical protein